MYEIPSLTYKYADLEPYFDEATMKVHHTKHHQTYADKLNAALDKHPELKDRDLAELIYAADQAVPADVRSAVVNNGGGYLNHNFFWTILGRPTDQGGLSEGTAIGSVLEDQYGGFENWKKEFVDQALGLFGSGWTWLLSGADGKLEIVNTANQSLPPSGKTAVLALDLWEHAYYLKFQNRRQEYIEAFFHVIDWSAVDRLYRSAIKRTA